MVDPATDSVLVNSEDGSMYRWNLLSNTLTEKVNITNGLGEAYTPTEIGPDGTVYAINNATLWAVGASPSANVYSTWTGLGSGNWSDRFQLERRSSDDRGGCGDVRYIDFRERARFR